MLGRGIAAALIGGALVIGASVPAASRAAHNPPRFRGRTSQLQPIAFTIASGQVSQLRFGIVITCANHHRYQLQASGFASIAIHAGRFRDVFSSKHPAASATVSGQMRSRHVTGTLRLRRYVAAEHGSCAGSATYTAARH